MIYFNPAVSCGEMYEADLYCLVGLAFAAAVSMGGLVFQSTLRARYADIATVGWVGVWMGGVCWAKAYMFRPPFNVAATMTSIIFFSVYVLTQIISVQSRS